MTDPGILVVNTGSSSVKLGVFEGARRAIKATVRRQANEPWALSYEGPAEAESPFAEAMATATSPAEIVSAFAKALAAGKIDIAAAGHRVVHGGQSFRGPTRLDAATMAALRTLSPLAPSHQPHNLAGVEAIASVWPSLPQSASFDTAFHRKMPDLAQLYALPKALSEDGVLRYGFHGLSYKYIAGRLSDLIGPAANGRVIVAHLGSGASLCALRNRKSQATTMGFTALDGLPMGTRCGDLDPGVLLHLMKDRGMALEDVETLLYKQSGLLGVSGVAADVRALTASDDPAANLALDLFAYRAARDIGSLMAAIGGLDVLVFTAGVGENSAEVRRRIAVRCHWAGVQLDEAANARSKFRIASKKSDVDVLVIPTDEELVIAQETQETCLS